MFCDDCVGRRQTETAAVLFGGEIRIENSFQVLWRNACTLIPHADPYIFPRHRSRHLLPCLGHIGKINEKATATGHGLTGIDGETGDNLLDLLFIDLGKPEVINLMQNKLNIAAGKIETSNFLHQGP